MNPIEEAYNAGVAAAFEKTAGLGQQVLKHRGLLGAAGGAGLGAWAGGEEHPGLGAFLGAGLGANLVTGGAGFRMMAREMKKAKKLKALKAELRAAKADTRGATRIPGWTPEQGRAMRDPYEWF